MMTRLDALLVAMSANVALAILLKGTLALAVALAAAYVARRQRAAVRHAVLLAAFAVLAALPVMAMVAPAVTIAVPVASQTSVLGDSVGHSVSDVTGGPVMVPVPAPSETSGSVGMVLPSLWSTLVALWGVGAAVCLSPILVGLWQVARLRRTALPWVQSSQALASIDAAGPRLSVVLHEAVPGPMTCGLWRHTILLPRDAESWAPDDLHRALIHELEHVRRNDWISQCLARATCAAYWFHPLVWVAWRQFTLEAERACDDAVLRNADATQYAEQLVALARRLSAAAKTPMLAMANRRDLATRVTAVLDSRQSRGRVGAAVTLLACVLSAAAVVALSSIQVVATAQAPGAGMGARFAVASIRPCPAGPATGFGQTVSPGRVVDTCFDVVSLVAQAYQRFVDGRAKPVWTAQRFLISGGPDWVKSDRYTIEAASDGTPAAAIMLGPMMQNLLEDRFKLSLHHEPREVPVYELTVAKGGPKTQVSQCVGEGNPDPGAPVVLTPGQHRCAAGWHLDANRVVWENEGIDLDQFAAMLRGFVDRPVVNATGISGPVGFRLEYEPSGDDPAAPLVTALKQQAGLELHAAKRTLDFLVIDHAERPTEGSIAQRAMAARFEAVSIRPCVEDTPPAGANGGQRSGQGGFPTISPGRFTIDCGTVERLISNAYVLNGDRLENNSPRIGDVSWWKGGPEWIRYDKFTIEASAPGVTDRAALLGPMLRTLLEERFALKLHRETETVPIYALTVAKGGLKIQPMPAEGCAQPDGLSDAATVRANAEAVNAGTAKPMCGGMTMMGSPGHSRWTIGGTTMPNFAGTLTASMDHFVIDKTGLDPETKYNIHLEFAPDEHVPGADKRNPRTEFPPPDAPSIFSALEQQLGLKLESAKGPQGVLVIDHVEHPKADGGFVVSMRARGAGR